MAEKLKDVLEIEDVEADVFVEVERFVDDLEVVEVVDYRFDEVDVVQCRAVKIELVGTDADDVEVQDASPDAG